MSKSSLSASFIRRLRALRSSLYSLSAAPLQGTPPATRPPPTAALVPTGSGRRLRHVFVIGVLLLGAFVGRRWYASAPLERPQIGISYSCAQARYLLGQDADCAAMLAAIIDGLAMPQVRLSLYWNEVEPQAGVFDFSASDALVAVAAAHGAQVLLTVGIKAQRFPEVYLPSWLLDTSALPENAVLDEQPGVHDAALALVRAAVQHYAAVPAVAAWQVENEPFIKNFQTIHGWTVSARLTGDEAALLRAEDPLQRRVVVTHSAWTVYDQSWKRALALGDVLGENVFTKKAWLQPWWYFFPYEAGPFTPNLPGQASLARRSGKQLWITELQSEPEEQRSLPRTLDGNAGSLTPQSFAAAIRLARRSGATRIYLWGAEWLYAVRATPRGSALWSEARAAIAAANPPSGGKP